MHGHLLRRVDSLEKTLMLGGIGGRRRRGQQRMRWLDGITDLMDIQGGAGEEGSQRVRCMERGESNAQTYTTVSKIDS